jgi:hypothetical protein
MRDLLEPFREEIEEYSTEKYSALEQAILLWRIIHYVLLKFKEDHPDWIFVRHEDLSRAPIREFGKIFDFLGLRLNSRAQKVIEKHTQAPPESEPEEDMDSIRRNSRVNIFSWKRRLTTSDICKIKDGTVSIADEFYGEDDW